MPAKSTISPSRDMYVWQMRLGNTAAAESGVDQAAARNFPQPQNAACVTRRA